MKSATIRIWTDDPDMSALPTTCYDWESSVYGNVSEQIPNDIPPPKGKYVALTHYVDANLMQCLLTGRFVTGILHFLNKTPVDWFSKKQPQVETATYGSEFLAARIWSSRLLTSDLHYVTWVYQYVRQVICLVIMKPVSIVPLYLMVNYTKDILPYPIIA